jgi:hypothetical protein
MKTCIYKVLKSKEVEHKTGFNFYFNSVNKLTMEFDMWNLNV